MIAERKSAMRRGEGEFVSAVREIIAESTRPVQTLLNGDTPSLMGGKLLRMLKRS